MPKIVRAGIMSKKAVLTWLETLECSYPFIHCQVGGGTFRGESGQVPRILIYTVVSGPSVFGVFVFEVMRRHCRLA
jgi:hypothetical protein